MARQINSNRKHYIAPWTDDATKPTDDSYERLASGIATMTNDTEDKSEDYNDYTGVDTTFVTGVLVKWTPEGYADFTDGAQKIVVSKQFAIGDDRKVWHKWVEVDGTTYEGVATLLEIKVSGGDSNALEALSFTIQHEKPPTVTPKAAVQKEVAKTK